jgi:hypothetical protein
MLEAFQIFFNAETGEPENVLKTREARIDNSGAISAIVGGGHIARCSLLAKSCPQAELFAGSWHRNSFPRRGFDSITADSGRRKKL